MTTPNIELGGISIPSGYLVGRMTPGTGRQELIALADIAQQVVALGIVASPGSPASLTLTQPAAGLTISGSLGTYTFALANDLAALEGLSSTGIAARTGTDTWAQRTITGTASRISVSNGGGVADNPTLDIDTGYVGQTSITTLGTVGTGTRAGTTVAVDHGGTGQTSYTNGQLLIGNSSGNTLTKATLTAGSNVTITNGGGSITIASTGGGGGDLTLIQTLTAASSATLDFTGLTETDYILIGRFLLPATDNVAAYIRFGTGAGPTWSTANYRYAGNYNNSAGGAVGVTNSGSASEFNLIGAVDAVGIGTAFTFNLSTDNSSYMLMMGNGIMDNNDGNMYRYTFGGRWTAPAAITGIRFLFSSGDVASGTLSLYSLTQ